MKRKYPCLTSEQEVRFFELKDNLFGKDMFVIDDETPEWTEYNYLMSRILQGIAGKNYKIWLHIEDHADADNPRSVDHTLLPTALAGFYTVTEAENLINNIVDVAKLLKV